MLNKKQSQSLEISTIPYPEFVLNGKSIHISERLSSLLTFIAVEHDMLTSLDDWRQAVHSRVWPHLTKGNVTRGLSDLRDTFGAEIFPPGRDVFGLDVSCLSIDIIQAYSIYNYTRSNPLAALDAEKQLRDFLGFNSELFLNDYHSQYTDINSWAEGHRSRMRECVDYAFAKLVGLLYARLDLQQMWTY